MKKPTDSTPEAPGSTPMAPPTARKRKRRISMADVETVAFLVETRRLQYREACLVTGIHYPSFRNWMARGKNEAKLSDTLAHVKASWIAGRLATIGDAETGKNGHRPDWRSAAWLLERTCKDRFSAQPAESAPQQPQPPIANYGVWIQAAYLGLAKEARPAIAVDAPPAEVLALPEPGTAEPPPGRSYWEGASLEVEPPPPPSKQKAPPMLPE